MDLSLDLVTVVVEDKEERSQTLPEHGTDLLQSELEGTVTD